MSEALANIEAEQGVLGALLYDNAALDQFDTLLPEHFFEPLHMRLFATAAMAIRAGETVDPVTLQARMARDVALEEFGGLGMLAELMSLAPPAYVARDYAALVQQLAIRRGLVTFANDTAYLATKDLGRSAFEVMGDIRRGLEHIETTSTPAEHTMIDAVNAADAAIANMRELSKTGKRRGRMTGLRCVDMRLGGLRAGALIVIGGRPSMGKTSLARAIAHGAAVQNADARVLFLGIEMGPEEMMQRELSALTREYRPSTMSAIEYREMNDGKMTEDDFEMIEAIRWRVPKNLILDDCHALGVEDVRRKIWAVQRQAPVACVVIDYLQLMRRPIASGRNDAAVLGEMTASLKQIARQAKTTIVLLSQLSRAVESRDDKRPQLADLRESGSIEQDADAVLFPYREAYYLERSEPTRDSDRMAWEERLAAVRHRLDVICAKQRQGPVGSDTQYYEPAFDFICDLMGSR